MNNVGSRQNGTGFNLYIDNSLHAAIYTIGLIGIQSYKIDKDGAKRMYNIELYYPSKTILFEYEDEELWLNILVEINEYL